MELCFRNIKTSIYMQSCVSGKELEGSFQPRDVEIWSR